MVAMIVRAIACGLLLVPPAIGQATRPAKVDPPRREHSMPRPTTWFATVYHDEGQVFLGSRLTRLFPFKNTTAASYTIKRILVLCSGASAWLVFQEREIPASGIVSHPVTIPPGGEGAVKLLVPANHLDQVSGSAIIETDDPECRMSTLRLQATVAPFFDVVPPSLDLGAVAWNQAKEFAFTVTTGRAGEWSVTQTKALPPGVKLAAPVRSVAGGKTTYSYQGTIGPGLPPGAAGGILRFLTDIPDRPFEFELAARVPAFLEISPPGHIGFGLVLSAEGSPARTVVVEDLDPHHDLRLEAVELGGLNRPSKWVELSREDGQGRYELTLRILPGAPPGELRGRLILTLSHPGRPRAEITFSAVVR